MAGTYRLPAELCPGDPGQGPTEVIAGGVLYFAGLSEITGCEVWRSDGTAEGTARLDNAQPGGFAALEPQSFAALGDRAYFAIFANGLWAVDAPSGSVGLIRAAPDVRLATATGNRLFFVAGAEGGESLWVSDGVMGGETRQIRFFPEAPCRDCDPAIPFLKPVDGGVVFLVTDSRRGSRLWRSDGTARGTYPVAGLPNPARLGLGYAIPGIFADVGSRLLFTVAGKSGTAQLWTASPLPASASPLVGCPEGCPAVTSLLQTLPGGGRAVFTGSARRSPETLWVSDGTAAGTRPLRDPCEGPCSSPATGFVALGDAVYFSVVDAAGPALWRTDGTRPGTFLLARVSLPSQPGGALLGDRVFLGASGGARVSELWSTDGTPAGTKRVRTFSRTAASSDPRFVPFGDGVLFTAWQDALTSGLWRSDGISTRKLADLCPGCGALGSPVPAGGLAFVLAGSGHEPGVLAPHLIRTDGAPAGTREILALDFDSFAESPFSFAERLFFLRCDTEYAEPGTDLHRCAFWASDGTPEGTGPRISALPATNDVSSPLVVGGSFYFSLFSRGGLSFYQSDGTEAGTRRIARIDVYQSRPLEMAEAGGKIFVAVDGGLGRFDASAPGGVDFFFGRRVSGLTELGGRLLFFGSSGEDIARTGLWSTDGTLEGTRLLSPVLEQTLSLDLVYGPPQWTRLGSRLLFRGWDPEHGFELWATDGTPEGTALLKDVEPGKGSSFPDSLVRAGSQVWLTASDGVHGRELWVSDGTPEGTRLALDLAPGPFSLAPDGLTLGGGNLFFSADAPFTGREPWVLPLQ